MLSSRPTIHSFAPTAIALAVSLSFALRAVAGEPTKGEAVQPGANGAAIVRTEEHASLQAALDALPEGGGKIESVRWDASAAGVLTAFACSDRPVQVAFWP